MEILIAALIGILLGFALAVLLLHNNSLGILKVVTSDTDGPYLFLELTRDVNMVMSKKYANFRVKITNVSQK